MNISFLLLNELVFSFLLFFCPGRGIFWLWAEPPYPVYSSFSYPHLFGGSHHCLALYPLSTFFPPSRQFPQGKVIDRSTDSSVSILLKQQQLLVWPLFHSHNLAWVHILCLAFLRQTHLLLQLLRQQHICFVSSASFSISAYSLQRPSSLHNLQRPSCCTFLKERGTWVSGERALINISIKQQKDPKVDFLSVSITDIEKWPCNQGGLIQYKASSFVQM